MHDMHDVHDMHDMHDTGGVHTYHCAAGVIHRIHAPDEDTRGGSIMTTQTKVIITPLADRVVIRPAQRAKENNVNRGHSQGIGRGRRDLVAQAINQAMAHEWVQAIATNRRLIDASGRDVEAHNRLGNAYAQLGRVAEARAAYTTTLAIDPTNTIAQRHVARLAALQD